MAGRSCEWLERRICRLNVCQTWPCWDETKIGQPDGGGCHIVVAAGRVDDRERVASPHEHPQHTVKLERSVMRSTVGSELARRTPQFEIVLWGSVSNMHTRSPSCMAATAKPMASVDFPVPPFWLAKVIVHTAFAFVAAAQTRSESSDIITSPYRMSSRRAKLPGSRCSRHRGGLSRRFESAPCTSF